MVHSDTEWILNKVGWSWHIYMQDTWIQTDLERSWNTYKTREVNQTIQQKWVYTEKYATRPRILLGVDKNAAYAEDPGNTPNCIQLSQEFVTNAEERCESYPTFGCESCVWQSIASQWLIGSPRQKNYSSAFAGVPPPEWPSGIIWMGFTSWTNWYPASTGSPGKLNPWSNPVIGRCQPIIRCLKGILNG